MEADILLGGLKKFGHERLGQPYRSFIQDYLDMALPVLGLIEDYLGASGKRVSCFVIHCGDQL